MKKLIFDIGCNHGNMTDVFLLHTDKVICFEPNPRLVEHLKRKFSSYLNDRVIIDSRGLSNSIEKKVFRISNLDTISTFSDDWITKSRFAVANNCNLKGQYHWNEEVIVQTATLDQVIKEYGIPDFVKIDVEGYELEVIRGLNKLHKDTVFSFEWAEEQYDKMNEIITHLKNLGYEKFAFTYGDFVTFGENLNWTSWEDLNIHEDIDVNRKNRWGMILFKF